MRGLLGLLVACTSAPPETPTQGAPEPSVPTWDATPLPRGALVIPEDDGITFLGLDGEVRLAPPWDGLVGACPICAGEGANPDGDGLLVSFTTSGVSGVRPGDIARIRGDGTLDFRVGTFGFPHDVIRDPADGTLMVVATSAHAVRWIPGDGSSNEPVRSLTSDHPEFPRSPNGAELLQHEDRTFLLLSHRPSEGRITMWDITTPGAPEFVWRFPAVGRVDVPHGPILRRFEGAWWLLWAHTEGLPDGNGTIGLAVTSDPAIAPTYVADLEPDETTGPLRFFRGVELFDDGTLVLTDSGAQGFGAGRGRVLVAQLPDVAPPVTGEIGRIGDQVFEPLGPTEPLLEGVGAPFEAWFWEAP